MELLGLAVARIECANLGIGNAEVDPILLPRIYGLTKKFLKIISELFSYPTLAPCC